MSESRQLKYKKKMAAIWRSRGCCADCGAPRPAGFYRCERCRESRREAAKLLMRRRRAALRGE